MGANETPVLLVAVPIGRLGDHHGRRKIMALALVGVAGSLCEVFIVCKFEFPECSRKVLVIQGSGFVADTS